jgi:hypothetical protein
VTATEDSDSGRAAKRASSWRQLVITRAERDSADLRAAMRARREGDCSPMPEIELLLQRAKSAAGERVGLLRWWSGSSQDLAWLSLHEAEAQIVGLLSGDALIAHARDLLVKARTLSMVDDERVEAVRRGLANAPAARPCCDKEVTWSSGLDAAAVVHLFRAVHGIRDERYAQSRGFRNRLIRLTLISLAALGLLTTSFATNAIPLPMTAVPSYLETAALVSLFGAIGALIVAVPPLAKAAGTWNPFSLPLYQLLLKLVLGPVFAIVGVLLLKSGLILNIKFPSDLPDLLTWAIVFGAAQQTVTRAVDRRAADIVSGEQDDAQESARRSGAASW